MRTSSLLTAACTKFLQRVEVGDIEGITSVITLAEVAHRLMILEAVRAHGLLPRAAVRKLKENPALVQQLSHYKVVTETVPNFNVVVEAITSTHLRTAQGFSATYGLLTNDSLTAAVMQSLALTDLASNDPDFSLVPALTAGNHSPERSHGIVIVFVTTRSVWKRNRNASHKTGCRSTSTAGAVVSKTVVSNQKRNFEFIVFAPVLYCQLITDHWQLVT